MRISMKCSLLVGAVALCVAVPARAQVRLSTLTPRQGLLSGSQGQVVNPVRDTKANLFLIGLGLVGAGLVLGGAGFAVLYACRDGTACHSDRTIQTVGWVLAAPGVIPLGIGLLLIYLASGSRSGSSVHGASPVSSGWTVGIGPTPGGGAMVSGAFRF